MQIPKRTQSSIPSTTPRETATIDEVCKMLHSNHPASLEAKYKTSPAWKKVIGYIAYLLESDAKISRPRIVQILKCDHGTIGEEIRSMASKHATGDEEVKRRLALLRASIKSRVGEDPTFSNADDVPKDGKDDSGGEPLVLTSESLFAAITKVSTLSITVLRGDDRDTVTMAVRDVAFFYLMAFLKMNPAAASHLLNRNPIDAKMALQRMRNLDPHRRQFLIAVAKETGVHVGKAIDLAEGV